MVYNLQAILCFLAPWLLGTSLPALMFLVFAVNTLGHISGPTESSVLPMVANKDQLATAASLIAFASAVGTAFGAALLTPILVRLFGVATVTYVAGVLLWMAATRVFDLKAGEKTAGPAETEPGLRASLNVGETLRWLAGEPAITTMIFVAVLAGSAQAVMQTLAPRYVHSVLGLDAAEAVYVFAPSALGLAGALIMLPRLMRLIGERNTTLLGFSIVTTTLFLLGLVHEVAPMIDPLNPARALALGGLRFSADLRTASLLALPLGFGLALTTTSVQTYLNRRVPHSIQGRAFALKSSLKNGAAIIPLTTLGAASEVFGVEKVLVASPFVMLALAYGLIQLSRHFGGHAPRRGLDVLATYWQEPQDLAQAAS